MLESFEFDQERKEALNTVAELIASTIEGAESQDVHDVLSSSLHLPHNWQEIVQKRAEQRRKLSATFTLFCEETIATPSTDGNAALDISEAPATCFLPELRPKTMPPVTTSATRGFECPSCGNHWDVVDARKSLRNSNTSSALRELSNADVGFCPVCEDI
ncbi:uncharacterized protein TEOVI_000365300 [Trypanosoma equiperdum]|uniref:Uncharacterized protein n=1 Tax=Trypanosoma equiperdum TaxID=5694 RepID=A0A1G4II43_TRYEQ|nr:hypothetical protein, conserved [Trypanosoma equiperdum]